MKTSKFNLQNWAGKEVSVSYTKAGKFEFFGYTFQLGDFKPFETDIYSIGKEGYRELFVVESTGNRKETDVFLSEDNLEKAVIQSVKYVANHF